MSRVLSEILAAEEPGFSMALHQLESASGRPGIDVRLVAEMNATIRGKIRELGLDPNDTTPKELYHGLQATIGRHDTFISQALGVNDPENVQELLPLIAKCVNDMAVNKRCWVLKTSCARKLLKANPPKKVMKILGYRSIDSMIKRENILEIYTATRFVESSQWQQKLIKSYKKLKSSDFESRDIEIIVLDAKRWGEASAGFIYEHHHNITHMKELGVILVLPLPVDRLRGATLTVLPMIIHYVTEIRLYSALFKLKQVRSDFSSFLIKTLQDDPVQIATMAGQKIHWRTIAKHFGSKKHDLPEVFEPHVQADDLVWRKTEDLLYRIEPALKFWEGLDFVALDVDGEAVSFNLIDNAVSYCNQLDYGQQLSLHVQGSLWNELYTRYMGQAGLEQEVLGQLGNEQSIDDALIAGI